MSEVTVSEFAQTLKVPVDRLIVQLGEAGIEVSGGDDLISEDAKLELLTHLRRSHGKKDASASAPRSITLKRKSQSELRLAAGQGRSRTVNVDRLLVDPDGQLRLIGPTRSPQPLPSGVN